MKLKAFFVNILTALCGRFRPKQKSLRQYGRLSHSQKDRKRPHLIAKYKMRCFWCGHNLTPETLTIDHYIPLSKGGSNKIKNLRLACNGCNNKRGNAMPEDTLEIIAEQSKIRFPNHWKKPKYHLGQRVKQGEIVGLEYHRPGTLRAYELGNGWHYWVCRDSMSDSVESCTESQIKPLSPTEIKEEIQAEIEFHADKLTALTQQLEEVQQS
ncbi:MAG: HNH endonuclease [Nostoc sp.]